MDQLATTHTRDMGEFIGALEVGYVLGIDDGALEASGGTALAPTKFQCGMYPTHRCHNDGMLEAAAGKLAAGPQTRRVPGFPGCM